MPETATSPTARGRNKTAGSGRGFYTTVPLEERFWAKVDKGDGTGCWLWTGSLRRGRDKKGYAQINVAGKNRPASQVSWEIRHGRPFPAGMYGCHTCDTPQCVRPDHIFPGTARDNIRDAIGKGRVGLIPPDQVREIRELIAAGHKLKNIGERFGVKRQSISDLKRGKTYASVV